MLNPLTELSLPGAQWNPAALLQAIQIQQLLQQASAGGAVPTNLLQLLQQQQVSAGGVPITMPDAAALSQPSSEAAGLGPGVGHPAQSTEYAQVVLPYSAQKDCMLVASKNGIGVCTGMYIDDTRCSGVTTKTKKYQTFDHRHCLPCSLGYCAGRAVALRYGGLRPYAYYIMIFSWSLSLPDRELDKSCLTPVCLSSLHVVHDNCMLHVLHICSSA